MRRTISAGTDAARGKIIRYQLGKARKNEKAAFLRLAGRVAGAVDLSERKGCTRK